MSRFSPFWPGSPCLQFIRDGDKGMKGKHKRISRRELKEQIRNITLEMNALRHELEDKQREYKKLKERFDYLGTSDEIHDFGDAVPVITREIKSIPFGVYTRIIDDEYMNTINAIELSKRSLAEELAKDMVELGYVRFVVNRDFTERKSGLRTVTVAAKMYVIPWEQAQKRPVINVRYMQLRPY